MYPSILDLQLETILLSENSSHWLSNFRCGHPEMERYIMESALEDNNTGKGVTYLVIDLKENKLVAYYTLATTVLLYFEEQNILNKDNLDEIRVRGIPSIEIKMFAVSTTYQNYICNDSEGKSIVLSDFILGSLIGDLYNVALRTVGFEAILLHSTPEAVPFYERNSFIHLDKYHSLYDEYVEGCKPMYLELFS